MRMNGHMRTKRQQQPMYSCAWSRATTKSRNVRSTLLRSEPRGCTCVSVLCSIVITPVIPPSTGLQSPREGSSYGDTPAHDKVRMCVFGTLYIRPRRETVFLITLTLPTIMSKVETSGSTQYFGEHLIGYKVLLHVRYRAIW